MGHFDVVLLELQMGQVIGERHSWAERAKSGSIRFRNILATIYRLLGIDAAITLDEFVLRTDAALDRTDQGRSSVPFHFTEPLPQLFRTGALSKLAPSLSPGPS